MSKSFKISCILTLAVIAGYITLLFVQPSTIITKIVHVNFNTPDRVDAVFYKEIKYLIIAGILCSSLLLLLQSRYRENLVSFCSSTLKRASALISVNVLLGLSLIYLAVLFYFAVIHYDLGFDEAWYISYARNFASTGILYVMSNGKIALIDNITMLPYYLLSVITFKAGLADVVYFKLLSSVLSGITLLILYRVTSKFYDRTVAIVAVFVLIVQPGFGFIASSFFGETSAMALLLLGLFSWLKNPPPYRNKTILTSALLFSLAVNTKFQLIIVLLMTLLMFQFTDRNAKALKVFVYTVIFTLGLVFVRTIPILIQDPKLVKSLVLISGFTGDGVPQFSAVFLADKLQLFNRFFPLPVMLCALAVFPFYMKNSFERFLFLFTSITFFWWIFFFPYATYRVPFMGIITLSIIVASLVHKLFQRTEGNRTVTVKYAAAITVIFLMAYGFSANIIYAYIGYNDGVQFDLDGTKSRLFYPASRDNSQKEFYGGLKEMISLTDTLYNGSYVTQCYLDNPLADITKLKESIQTNPDRKYLLITRERYPQGIEKGRQMLDSLHTTYQLGLKLGDYEIYKIKK